MALETIGEEVMKTASGRLTAMEMIKPRITVLSVARVWSAMGPARATLSVQMMLGAGRR